MRSITARKVVILVGNAPKSARFNQRGIVEGKGTAEKRYKYLMAMVNTQLVVAEWTRRE